MNEKYINFDIDDPRASAIAEVMANSTSKKILSVLVEKEMSESDISSELKIPLNTVGYNINKLLKSGLIEKSKNFFWSVKGKKIPTYKVSDKKIMISPKSSFKGILPALLISLAAALGIRLYYLSSNTSIGASQSAPLFAEKAASTSANAQDYIVGAGNNILQQVHVTSEYSWLWFLLGALISILLILFFNRKKMMKGGKNE